MGVGIDTGERGGKKKGNKYKCDATGSALDTQTLNSLLFAKKENATVKATGRPTLHQGNTQRDVVETHLLLISEIDSLKRFLI